MQDGFHGDERRAERFGELSARMESIDKRITDHIDSEGAVMREIFAQLKGINDTLSQATGARKILVWIIATIFAGIALAKGWAIKP